MRCIHYGSGRFWPERWRNVRMGLESYLNVPDGGLWACPLNSKLSWKDYVKKDKYNIIQLQSWFTFDAVGRLLTIDSYDDLQKVWREYPFTDTPLDHIRQVDFAKMANDYDVFHLTPDGLEENTYAAPTLAAWCSETVYVLNINAIQNLG